MKGIGQVIRYKRQIKGWTQKMLAAHANIEQPRVSEIELERRTPSEVELRSLRIALNDDLVIPDAAELKRMGKVAPQTSRGYGQGRDPDVARARWIAYWGQFDACPQSYCKALAKMPCKQDHNWAKSKRIADRACDARPKLKEES